MILGEPTTATITEWLETDGCPYCGELPGWIDITTPGVFVLEGFGHTIDASSLISDNQMNK